MSAGGVTFFEGQALARRNTKLLVVLYLLAVVAVIAAVDLILATSWVYGVGDAYVPRGTKPSYASMLKLVPGTLWAGGALVTSLVIFCVSGYEVLQLAAGGDKVAEMVGARRVSPETRDPLERRLLNVVEEMSIASGVRLPKVYVMDGEPGINAFAAGYDISNSVVAVTRGALETFNRDELQAVIGHEFSHILNGDMRLNIRMMGVLAGIVFIGAVGEFLMRSVGRSRSRDGAVWAIFVAGLGLFLIGYIGLFFARLIKAAVSRQREFLADASSVQFTRNPDGIAGALDQIDASSRGALIENRHAEDMSHMFFGQGISVWLGGLFDTHPPVAERIKAAHPRFDPDSYRKARAKAMARSGDDGGGEAEAARPAKGGDPLGPLGVLGPAILAGADMAAGKGVPPAGRRAADAGNEWGRSAAESAKVVGTLQGGALDFARRLLAGLPPAIRDGIQGAEGAAATVLALMLAPKDDVMGAQIEAARAAGAGALAEAAAATAPAARRLGAALHLPVVDLALPALKAADAAAKDAFLKALAAVIHADRRVSLHEFVVYTLVKNQLAPAAKPGAAGNRRIAELEPHVHVVMAIMAHAGTRNDVVGERQQKLEAAMRAGLVEVGLPERAAVATGLSVESAGNALDELRMLAPMQKGLLVKGLFAVATHDGTIRVVEAELMRLVGAVLDCPLPPLLTEIDPATLAA